MYEIVLYNYYACIQITEHKYNRTGHKSFILRENCDELKKYENLDKFELDQDRTISDLK